MRLTGLATMVITVLLCAPGAAVGSGGVPTDGNATPGAGKIDLGADDPGDPSSWAKKPTTRPKQPSNNGGGGGGGRDTGAKAPAAPACNATDRFGCGFASALGGGGAPPPPPNPAELAQRATGRLDLPTAAARTSPADPVETLVGLQTWLWVDPGAWQPITESITAGNTTVTATVRPTGSRWNMGEGSESCSGPGKPWRRGLGQDARTDCGYTYQSTSSRESGGKFRVSATVTYAASWTCTGACTSDGGDLGSLQSPASVSHLQVGEREPVVIQ